MLTRVVACVGMCGSDIHDAKRWKAGGLGDRRRGRVSDTGDCEG
jgi:hypothetical protein